MGFVGTFVGRKTCVAVDAVDAFSDSEPPDRRIERNDAVDQPFRKAVECLLHLAVTGPMLFEPFPVVVSAEFPQKSEYVFHAYLDSFSCKDKKV